MAQKLLDKDVQELVNHLHEDDREILKKFNFTLDGEQLTESASLRFIQFVKQEFFKNQ